MYEISKTIEFEAAHFLRNYKGKCEKIHGHCWKVAVGLTLEKLDDQGIAFDFTVLKELLKKNVIKKYDHNLLNEIPPFNKINPSAENLAETIFQELKNLLPLHENFWVQVWESSTSWAKYWEKNN